MAIDHLCDAAAGSLAAVDLAFADGLSDRQVLRLLNACSALCRCNLRGAKVVGAHAYNEAASLMLARQQAAAANCAMGPDAVENRRRPRHLAPRTAPPFFYLKRTRQQGP